MTEKKCLAVKGKLGFIRFNFNPVTTIISALIIWGFVTWCIVKPKESLDEMGLWKRWITEKWTWMYIGTQDVWSIFIIILYFSKYGNMKLGRDDEKPEFSDASYFTMLFAAGIGIGLFYFGVSEPVWHYSPGPYGNRWYDRYNDNQRAQDAINVTLFHWGIHAWIVYVVMAILLGFMAYRKGLPLTMRSCFYPLVGDRIFGWVGDMVDILSIISTMFGVCTSLGIGVMQLNNGFHRINNKIEENTTNQLIIIWSITAVATLSVVSGLKLGIRRLSETCFALGTFILLFILFHDDTWYLLNIFVQSIGYYFQWIIQLGWHTDAFAQLGNAPDKKEAPTWMDDWTIFYWGWWIAWSPFVGMFIAKISRGRTIKQMINYTLTVPIIYVFFWFSVFGGVGLKMERDAEIRGIVCSSFLGGTNSTASDNGLYRLSCRGKNDMWFDVMDQYENFGTFLSILSLTGIVLYFVTSSDSGSLVIDCLSSNGEPEPPVLQRIFWALTEGATATALLYAGGRDALIALQTTSIAVGLPYTIIICFVCVALWRAVQEEAGDIDPVNDPQFSTGLFDLIHKPSESRFLFTIVCLFAPWFPLARAACSVYDTNLSRSWIYMLVMGIPFNAWILLMILEVVEEGMMYIAFAVLFGFFAYATGIRSTLREKYNIRGNMFEDFFAVMLLYPLAAVQICYHVDHQVPPDEHAMREIVVENTAARTSEPESPPAYEEIGLNGGAAVAGVSNQAFDHKF